MLAQRLVRRVCTVCRRSVSITEDIRALFASENIEVDELYEATGCEHCNHRGYSGRTGLFELIIADDALKDLVKTEEPQSGGVGAEAVGTGSPRTA